MLILPPERHRTLLPITILAILATAAILLSACQSRSPQAASAQLVSAPTATQSSEATLTPTADSPANPNPMSTATVTPIPTSTATPAPTATETARSNSDADSQAAPLFQTPGSTAPPKEASLPSPQGDRAPRRIMIPKLGVNAPIVVVGVLANGEMGVPSGPDEVAWYGEGAVPGLPGNALLGGHLDWGNRGAVFWRLRDLRLGDRVQIEGGDGSISTFAVTSSNAFAVDDAPVDEIFADGPEPTITLITCEGVFDRATRNYSHRRVVAANLVP